MNDPRLQALSDQLDTILLLLERPTVQNQLIAFIAIFLLSWLLPEPLGALLNKLLVQQDAITKHRQKMELPINTWRIRLLRWLRGAQLLIFPVVGIISTQLTIGYFASIGWHVGLLQRLGIIFWLFLIYQFVGSLLFGSLAPERAKAFHRRIVTPIFIILITISLGAGLAGAFPILKVELFRILDTPLTVTTVATAALVLYATTAIGWATNEALRNLVLPHAQVDSGVTNTVLIITRYAIIAIGILVAISILGVDLSAFAIIGGGLSVGIGFGLQDLVANFISGILLLFEQTLRPGDVIEVGGHRGRVNQMRMRSAVLRTAENVDIYVPNKTLLTSTVSAYTNINQTTRKTLNVGVSYDSDPIEVRNALQEVIDSHGLVLKEPAPAVFFTGFGSFTMDFEIVIWIGEPGRAAAVLSDLHFMIYREFTKRGIEIPVPQQDFRLRADPTGQVEQLLAIQPVSFPRDNADNRTNQTRTSHLTEKEEQDKKLQGGEYEPTPPSKSKVDVMPGLSASTERVSAPTEKPALPG